MLQIRQRGIVQTSHTSKNPQLYDVHVLWTTQHDFFDRNRNVLFYPDFSTDILSFLL